jgi:hypothetical protein
MFFVETMYTFFGSPHIHVFSWKNEINFTGINKHGQSIQLGYSFLGNEKAERFTWLFQTFKKVVGGSPACIITDQDVVMAAAISIVFAESTHRNCRWHIMEKVRKRWAFFGWQKRFMCRLQ